MKIPGAALTILCGFVGIWHLGEKLSPDALGMMVGLLFGMLAGIPAALLTLYAVRNSPPAEAPPTHTTRWIIMKDDVQLTSALRGNITSDEQETERLHRRRSARRMNRITINR
jgi:hypothetical protein